MSVLTLIFLLPTQHLRGGQTRPQVHSHHSTTASDRPRRPRPTVGALIRVEMVYPLVYWVTNTNGRVGAGGGGAGGVGSDAERRGTRTGLVVEEGVYQVGCVVRMTPGATLGLGVTRLRLKWSSPYPYVIVEFVDLCVGLLCTRAKNAGLGGIAEQLVAEMLKEVSAAQHQPVYATRVAVANRTNQMGQLPKPSRDTLDS
jgi:hypothetical protein